MSEVDADVLVVGAGPTGLALALQAHDHGAHVRIVERRTETSRPSRALIVHPRTLEVLRPLGVTDALLARGDVAPLVHLHVRSREIPVRLGRFALDDTAFPYLLFARQADVESVLADAAAQRAIIVQRGAELVDLRPVPDGVEATLRQGRGFERATCQYVAGCDGAASTVRRLAGVDWHGGRYRQEVVLADVELDGDLTPDVAHAVVGRTGLFFLFALGERATWRMLATRPAVRGAFPGPGPERPLSPDVIEALVDGSGLPVRVAAVAWSSAIPLEHRLASRYRMGRLFLAGDAAHRQSPAGGHGMNTGIQDALNLGWKLAFAASSRRPFPPAGDPLLDSYEQERRPVARQVLAMTNAMFWAEAATSVVPSLARSVLMPFASPLVPGLLHRRRLVAEGIRTLSRLRVHYRHSVLSVEGTPGGRRGRRPGDRLPDARVTMARGSGRLHELLAAPGVHVLLDRDAPGMPDGSFGPLVRMERVLDWPGAGVRVVRPDGYIGFRAGRVDASQIRSWLSLVGIPEGHGAPVSGPAVAEPAA